MGNSDGTGLTRPPVADKDTAKVTEHLLAEADQPQSPTSKSSVAQLPEGSYMDHTIDAKTPAADERNTIRADDESVIPCEGGREQQHASCYDSDQENEILGGDFSRIRTNCTPPAPSEGIPESTDDEEDSEYEYTSGYSEASAAASQFGEASMDGSNVPDVFLYMTQDVQYVSSPGEQLDGGDTLRIPSINPAAHDFREQFFALSQIPLRWEDPKRMDEALAAIPLHQLNEQAHKAEQETVLQKGPPSLNRDDNGTHEKLDQEWGYEDFITMALMQWFKRDFFTWETQNRSCPMCSSPMVFQGEVEPTAQEREDSALAVELYTCSNMECGAPERFPRYSDPWQLLKTRRGRLAEWANCFGMLCRALGSRVRWVWNADKGHIWLEVYSEKKARWVSIDIYEVAWDEPTLYTEAWSQKMSYCIAFSADGPTDVTRRYVRSVEFQLPRNRCSAAELEDIILELRELRRADLDERQRLSLEEADDAEEAELSGYAPTLGRSLQGEEKEDEKRGRSGYKYSPPSSQTLAAPQASQIGVDKGKGIAVI